jgi:hypothetical protein
LRVSRLLNLALAPAIEAKANQFENRSTEPKQEDNAHFDEAKS